MNKAKILVVDDDLFNQEVLSLHLEEYGLETVIADNGKKALELIQNGDQINLIFMDINMPIMNGPDATKAIREYEYSSKTARIPIVAAGASIDPNERADLFKAGMDDIITKPIMIDELERVLNTFIFKTENFTYDLNAASQKLMIPEQMIKDFIHKLTVALDEELVLLRDMVNKQEYESLRELSHKLKGRSGNLQIMKMHELFSLIEKKAKAKETFDYENLIDEISNINEELKKL
jgi:CheY-like chemotaxis protein